MSNNSSSSKSGKMETRYAPYVEEKHHDMIELSVYHRDQVINSSPYAEYNDLEIDDVFLGAGYILSDFPSLYDMFGKFMSGLDVDVIYKKIFGETITESEINPYLQSEASMIDMDITTQTLPTFLSAFRGLNAVTSSSFIIGKSNIENKRIKALARISSDLKQHLIPLVSANWKTFLDWNKNTVTLYAFHLKLYFMSRMVVDETNNRKAMENSLWPFKVLEYNQTALVALTRAYTIAKQKARERSAISQGFLVASYTAQGAVMGSYIGGPYGAVIGGVIGFFVGVAIVLFE